MRLLFQHQVRVELDDSGDSFNKRVRNAITEKVPNILILGGREAETDSVTWRRYGHKEQKTLPVAEFLAILKTMIGARVMDNLPETELPAG